MSKRFATTITIKTKETKARAFVDMTLEHGLIIENYTSKGDGTTDITLLGKQYHHLISFLEEWHKNKIPTLIPRSELDNMIDEVPSYAGNYS